MYPTLTCILPVHNGEAYVAQALASVQVQNPEVTEIVVVDDGSNDGTAQLVQRMSQADSRIRYLNQSQSGTIVALNHGIRASRGEVLAFIDADDLWVAQRTALQLPRFQACPELDISVGHCQNFFDWREDADPQVQAQMESDPRLRQPCPAYITTGALIRRRAYEHIGMLAEDRPHAYNLDWFLRARQAGLKEELIPEVVFQRRIHGNNQSIQKSQNSHFQFASVLRDRIRLKAVTKDGS